MNNLNNSKNNTSRKPWLSIVIPVYNTEKYLRKCLDSIAVQSFSDFEVILIDDGSTDSSPEICNEYALKDNRFRYFKKENGGSYKARIYGANKALGTYIMFCDSDDYYCSKKAFEILYNHMKDGKYQVIQFNYQKKYNHLRQRCVFVEHELTVDKNEFISHEYPKLLCSFWDESHLMGSLCNKIYHRALLSNLPDCNSAERIFWGDDQITNLHLLSTCDSIMFIPDILYCYRQFSGSTNKFSDRTMKDVDNIKKYQLLFLEHYNGEAKERIRSVLFSEIAGWFLHYVRQAYNYLDETELAVMINETLDLPRFVLAREYYAENTYENWEPVNMLRRADAAEYIQAAKTSDSNGGIKERMVRILKKIYMSI